MSLLTVCQATFSNVKEAVVDTKAPADPYKGLSWTDTSKTPPVTKVWDGSKWVDSIADAVDGIEIGGRNLLRESNIEKMGTNEYLEYADLLEIFDAHGEGTYTIGFDIMGSKAGSGQVYCNPATTDSFKYLWIPHMVPISITGGYERKSITVDVVLNNPDAKRASLSFYFAYGSGVIPSVKNVKVERGNKATDWTPAPEDLQSGLDSANAVIQTHTEKLATHDARINASQEAIDLRVTKSEYESYKTMVNGELAFAKSRLSVSETNITALQGQISLKVEQTDIDAAAAQARQYAVDTRTDNIIINGDGRYGDLTGWARGTFDGADAPEGCYGSFCGSRTDMYPISFDNGEVYDLEFWAKNAEGNTEKFYFASLPYDRSRNAIEYHMVNYVGLTRLTKDLNPGDTVLYAEDLSGWSASNADTMSHWRRVGFHDYKDPSGYTYPVGYAREFANFQDGSAINTTDNTITLSNAWAGKAVPAGTHIAQHYGSSTYVYSGISGKVPPEDWTKYKCEWELSTDKRFKYARYVSLNAPYDYALRAKIAGLSLKRQAVTSAEIRSVTAQMQSAIDIAKDSITQSVSQTYATKSEVSTVSGNVDTLTSRVTAAESKLTKDSLVTTIGSYYATLADIEVGGRNLVRNSNAGWSVTTYRVMSGKLSEQWVPGETYTISIKGSVEGGDFGLWRDDGNRRVTYTIPYDADRGLYIHTFTCPEPHANDNTYDRFSIYNYPSTAAVHATIEWVKIEKGSVATDWTPAPEDTLAYIADVETIAAQTAEKFNWLVKSGTSATDFTLTDRTATLVANAINLKGLVTFSGLDSAAQGKINAVQSLASGAQAVANAANNNANTANNTANTAKANAAAAQSTADTAKANAATAQSTADTAKANAATAQSTADAAQTTANAADSAIAAWCYENDRTYINGGKIYAGSITAKQIDVEDLFAQDITATGTIRGVNLIGSCVEGGEIHSYGSEISDSAYTRVGSVHISDGAITTYCTRKSTTSTNEEEYLDTVVISNGLITVSTREEGFSTGSKTNIYPGYINLYPTTKRTPTVMIDAEEGGKIIAEGVVTAARISAGYDSGVNNSVNCSNWFRSSGSSGWYNATYGGGWYMSDTAWIRSYGGKNIYHDSGILRTDGTLQVGGNGAYFSANSGGASFGVGLNMGAHAISFSGDNGIYSTTMAGYVVRQYTSGGKVCSALGHTAHPTRVYGSACYLNGSSTAITSDRRLKTDLTEFDDRYDEFFMGLKPELYKYKDGTSGRYHAGYVAQDVEESLIKSGIDSAGFAGFIKDSVDAEYLQEIFGYVPFTDVQYYLRYEEFIALNTYMIQKNRKELVFVKSAQESCRTKMSMLGTRQDSQEARIESLQNQLSEARIQLAQQASEIAQLRGQLEAIA